MRKNPEKTSPRKLARTGDQTRARCVTGAHATACSTAVDAKDILVTVPNLLSNQSHGKVEVRHLSNHPVYCMCDISQGFSNCGTRKLPLVVRGRLLGGTP